MPIEWKYVECYGNKKVFDEVSFKDGVERVNRYGLTKGEERARRYFGLIEASRQLNPTVKEISNYKPFYQLMRQTLWAEKMIENSAIETIKAVDFIHVHIIPRGNSELLDKKYSISSANMECTWRGGLTNQSKYQIIEPKDLLLGVDKTKYSELIKYLQKRYW